VLDSIENEREHGKSITGAEMTKMHCSKALVLLF